MEHMDRDRTHRERYQDQYGDDPFVTPEQLADFMEEADERDRQDADQAEAVAYWDKVAAEEEGEPA